MHRSPRGTVLLTCLFLIGAIAGAPGTALAADGQRTARLLTAAGLLEEAERAQALYVAELERLRLPDDGDVGLALAVRSAFPPNRIRDRWIRLLAEQLTTGELAAAEAFHGSVPGQALAQALRATRGSDTPVANAPPELATAVRNMEAPAREAVLRVRTAGAARWLAALVAGNQDADLARAWDGALADHGDARREREMRALLAMAPIHALGFAEYAASTDGRRFYGKLTAALDVALTRVVEERRGLVLAAAASVQNSR